MICLNIDGIAVEAGEDMTILEAAQSVNIRIPTLCYMKEVNEIRTFRMCVVEVEGMNKLPTACNALIKEGMHVQTKSERVIETRKTILNLLLSNHHRGCFS